MHRRDSDIYPKDVPNLIRKLINFFGQNEIVKCLSKYEMALKTSGPIYRDHYMKTRHPWWEILIEYRNLERSGKVIYRNLTKEIMNLAGDAKKLSILQRDMPKSVKSKYKQNLLDDEGSKSHLFELDIAWHYHLRGHKIIWHEYESEIGPEFSIKTDSFTFDVECKRLSVDAFKKIRRRDFYHLIEILLDKLSPLKLKGTIALELEDRLPSNIEKLEILSDQILKIIQSGKSSGAFRVDAGDLTLYLSKWNDEKVDLKMMSEELWKRKSPREHGTIFASSFEGQPANPIEMTCKSKSQESILPGMRKMLSKAILRQLSPEKPGLIACFIPEIEDFRGLETDSGLQAMTYDLFNDEKRKHIAAIIYSSDTRFYPTEYGHITKNQALIFRNSNCRYESANNFDFLNFEFLEKQPF